MNQIPHLFLGSADDSDENIEKLSPADQEQRGHREIDCKTRQKGERNLRTSVRTMMNIVWKG